MKQLKEQFIKEFMMEHKKAGIMRLCYSKLKKSGMEDVPSDQDVLEKFLQSTQEGKDLMEQMTIVYEEVYAGGLDNE